MVDGRNVDDVELVVVSKSVVCCDGDVAVTVVVIPFEIDVAIFSEILVEVVNELELDDKFRITVFVIIGNDDVIADKDPVVSVDCWRSCHEWD